MFTLLKSLPTLSTLELSRLERALAVERQHRAGLWSLPDDSPGCIVQPLPGRTGEWSQKEAKVKEQEGFVAKRRRRYCRLARASVSSASAAAHP